MKVLIIAMLFMMCILSGCAWNSEIKKPIKVEVPVIVKCSPKVVVTPINSYPMDSARKDMPLYDKLQLALSELSLVKGNNKELTAALKECTK